MRRGSCRVAHELAALGDEEVHVTIAVEVREYSAVVATVVGVWIVAESRSRSAG